MFDLGPAADEMTRLVTAVSDEQLAARTPCSEWTVADLLAHVHQFATVFTDNARKAPTCPPDSLHDDWRAAIPEQLSELADAWRQDSAWHGRVSAGGVDMAAADNAIVCIEELTMHGWDLAQATGQHVVVDDAWLDQVDVFFELFGERPFGPSLPAPDGATRLHRTLMRTGRDPSWTPAP